MCHKKTKLLVKHMSFSYACSKTLSPLPAKKAQRAVIGKRNTCVLCETSELLICHSHRRKGILIHCIFKKVKKKKKKSSVQAERGYHEETSQIQGSSQRSLLARTYLQQKVLVQVSSLCRGHVVLSFLLLLKQRGGRNKLQEEDAAFARKRCRREEEEEG